MSLQELAARADVPEWRAILLDFAHRHPPPSPQIMGHIRALDTRIHAAHTLVDYARATVSRLIMRQVASEIQAIIIRDVMSRRKTPLPQGAAILDSIESLEKRGVKLTKAERARLDEHLAALGINNREFALLRLFRQAARDIAHPDFSALPHSEINETALDGLKANPELEKYGRELLDTYWRTIRYFSDLHTAPGPKARKKIMDELHKRTQKISHLEKVDRFGLQEDFEKLPVPTFPEVITAMHEIISDKAGPGELSNMGKRRRSVTVKRRRHRQRL